MLILSIGENCLPGRVLQRFGINNTWSTPYTWARTNIFYALMWEKEYYRDLLNKKYICKKSDSFFPELYRNIKYVDVREKDKFDKTVLEGFLFAHHNIIEDDSHFESYLRKIDRMMQLRYSDEDILFIYHHRYVENDNNIDAIVELGEQFIDIYRNRNRKCNIVIIKQKIIQDGDSRKIVFEQYGKCYLCEFYTKNVWAGFESGFVSGEIDDDLFIDFFRKLYSMGVIENTLFLDNYQPSIYYYISNNSMKFYKTIVERLNIVADDHFYLWGAGQWGVAMAKYLLINNLCLTAIIDNNADYIDIPELAIPILKWSDIKGSAKIFITVKNKAIIADIKKQIESSKIETSIITLEDIARGI